MEGKREGDIIICTIYTFFFLCLTCGGSFLFVYMLSDRPQEWHVVAGMTLVGLPWGFWFLTCAYTFVKHGLVQPKHVADHPTCASHHSAAKSGSFKAATPEDRSPAAEEKEKSGSVDDRHVRFAGVVVMGGEGESP